MEENNKKICILTTVHPVFDTRIFHKEAKTLVNAGYDLVLIAQHSKEEIVDGVRIVPLPKARNRFFRFFSLCREAYKLALKEKADVYHFHDPELLPWALKLKKKTEARIIYDIHENIAGQILDKTWIPKTLRKPLAVFYLLKEKKVLPFIDWIILAEGSYLRMYKNYKNISIVRNYPLILKKLSANGLVLQYDFPKIVYVGGISKARGIFEMIQTAKILKKKFKNTRFDIAGLTGEKIRLEIDNLIKYYGLSETIFFYGRISHPEALHLIFKANVGLSLLYPIPNYIDSLPTKLFEYMAAGLPVIASNFSLWKEIVEGSNCGICVNPLEPKEIARAVEYLMANPEEAKKMGENGRKAVLEKYNWENEAKKLKVLYRKILE
jgi:glycosyltransferase involved in cell wall biosynthesis